MTHGLREIALDALHIGEAQEGLGSLRSDWPPAPLFRRGEMEIGLIGLLGFLELGSLAGFLGFFEKGVHGGPMIGQALGWL
jgi:hypothetical protein